jgi:hypothetical protein
MAFRLFLVRDISEHEDDAEERPIVVSNGGRTVINGHLRAIGSN